MFPIPHDGVMPSGVMVMHPFKPSLDGRGLLDMRDVNGVYLFAAMNELVEEKGEGGNINQPEFPKFH